METLYVLSPSGLIDDGFAVGFFLAIGAVGGVFAVVLRRWRAWARFAGMYFFLGLFAAGFQVTEAFERKQTREELHRAYLDGRCEVVEGVAHVTQFWAADADLLP